MPEHMHLIVRPQATVYDLARIRAAIKEPSKRAIRHLEERAPDGCPHHAAGGEKTGTLLLAKRRGLQSPDITQGGTLFGRCRSTISTSIPCDAVWSTGR